MWTKYDIHGNFFEKIKNKGPKFYCFLLNWRLGPPNCTVHWWFKSWCMWEEPCQPCHIHTYTVYTSIGGKGRCHTRGESEESVVHRQGSTHVRESTLALKRRADITRSPKQGYQWPHKKDLCPTNILKKKLYNWASKSGGWGAWAPGAPLDPLMGLGRACKLMANPSIHGCVLFIWNNAR